MRITQHCSCFFSTMAAGSGSESESDIGVPELLDVLSSEKRKRSREELVRLLNSFTPRSKKVSPKQVVASSGKKKTHSAASTKRASNSRVFFGLKNTPTSSTPKQTINKTPCRKVDSSRKSSRLFNLTVQSEDQDQDDEILNEGYGDESSDHEHSTSEDDSPSMGVPAKPVRSTSAPTHSPPATPGSEMDSSAEDTENPEVTGGETSPASIAADLPAPDMDNLLTKVVQRMDAMEKELKSHISSISSSSHGKRKSAKPKTPISLLVRSEVRRTYRLLLEKEDNDFEGFDYSSNAPFNGPTNESVVKKLIKEVITNNPQFQASEIRASAYTFYRTNSQRESQMKRGIYDSRNRKRKRRERLNRKLQERLSLFKKSTIPVKTKEKWMKIFQADYISSEESGSDSEEIFVKPLAWRADLVTKFFKTLDRSNMEKKTAQAKRQRKKRVFSTTPSTRTSPAGAPKWATK